MITLKQQWELIKPIWRIMVAIVIIQIIGAIISISSNTYSHPFISLWYGGAVSSFPGFLVGLVWQIYTPKDNFENKLTLFITVAIGIMAIAMTTIAFFLPLEQFATEINKVGY